MKYHQFLTFSVLQDEFDGFNLLHLFVQKY